MACQIKVSVKAVKRGVETLQVCRWWCAQLQLDGHAGSQTRDEDRQQVDRYSATRVDK